MAGEPAFLHVSRKQKAVGVGAVEKLRAQGSLHGTTVTLATAHPAKFPDAVEAAVGVRPPLPAHLSDLFERTEHIEHCDATLDAVEAHVRAGLAAR